MAVSVCRQSDTFNLLDHLNSNANVSNSSLIINSIISNLNKYHKDLIFTSSHRPTINWSDYFEELTALCIELELVDSSIELHGMSLKRLTTQLISFKRLHKILSNSSISNPKLACYHLVYIMLSYFSYYRDSSFRLLKYSSFDLSVISNIFKSLDAYQLVGMSLNDLKNDLSNIFINSGLAVPKQLSAACTIELAKRFALISDYTKLKEPFTASSMTIKCIDMSFTDVYLDAISSSRFHSRGSSSDDTSDVAIDAERSFISKLSRDDLAGVSVTTIHRNFEEYCVAINYEPKYSTLDSIIAEEFGLRKRISKKFVNLSDNYNLYCTVVQNKSPKVYVPIDKEEYASDLERLNSLNTSSEIITKMNYLKCV